MLHVRINPNVCRKHNTVEDAKHVNTTNIIINFICLVIYRLGNI